MNDQFQHETPRPQNSELDINNPEWIPAMLAGFGSGMTGGTLDVLLKLPVDGRLAAFGSAAAGIAITRLLSHD